MVAREEAIDAVTASEWGGGVSPYAVGTKKLGMWLFIVGDAFTFAALLVGYGYFRVASVEWPRPFDRSTIVVVTIMTFFLLSSSATMAIAVAKSRRGKGTAAIRFLVLTMLGGLLFMALHANEWKNLIAQGARLFDNPWGVPLFTATFFTITGLHMAHVASGVIVLGVIAWGLARGRYSAEDVEVSGLYWHFVDLVWMFVFPLIYLMSVKY